MSLVRRGKILAVDLGTRNVGMAECDALTMTVTPLPSLRYRSRQDLIRRIAAAIPERGFSAVVVGVPWNMDGSSGASARRAQKFVAELADAVGLPVHGVDERLSTAEATELWRKYGARKRKHYRTVDSLAAALILERFLHES